MPEFILNGKDNPEFESFGAFTRGYIEAMFFTEEERLCEESNGGDSFGFKDLAAETLEKIKADCASFIDANRKTLADAWSRGCGFLKGGYDEMQAGRDFWFTRNGHGVGFWDRGLGEVGDELSAACGYGTDFPPVDIYVGDDGKIYIL